jgi:hypothetical protein
VAIEVIERKLMAALSGILSPMAVYQMNDDLVSFIAGESQASRAERMTLSKQVEVLTKGSKTCKRFAKVRLGSELSRALLGDHPAHVDDSATTEPEPVVVNHERGPAAASSKKLSKKNKRKKQLEAEMRAAEEAEMRAAEEAEMCAPKEAEMCAPKEAEALALEETEPCPEVSYEEGPVEEGVPWY